MYIINLYIIYTSSISYIISSLWTNTAIKKRKKILNECYDGIYMENNENMSINYPQCLVYVLKMFYFTIM
jgi:hypothetical protein